MFTKKTLQDLHHSNLKTIIFLNINNIVKIKKIMIMIKIGLVVDTDLGRLCGELPEGVMHITSGCKMLATREYMARHNNLLKILMVAWGKKNELMERNPAWYKVKW